MKLWAGLIWATVMAAGIPDDWAIDNWEKGPKECDGIKVLNVNGVKWLCGARGTPTKDRPYKKCRGRAYVLSLPNLLII